MNRMLAIRQRRQADLDRWAAGARQADSTLQRAVAADEREVAAHSGRTARRDGGQRLDERERLADLPMTLPTNEIGSPTCATLRPTSASGTLPIAACD